MKVIGIISFKPGFGNSMKKENTIKNEEKSNYKKAEENKLGYMIEMKKGIYAICV